jgi:hypothetical protein
MRSYLLAPQRLAADTVAEPPGARDENNVALESVLLLQCTQTCCV